MSEDYLKIKLNKKCWGIHLRWESVTLSPEEIDYAAKDVQVAIELFKYFTNKLQAEELPNQTYNVQYMIDHYCALYFNARYHRRAPPDKTDTSENTPMNLDEI